MERRLHKRFEVHLPVVAKVGGSALRNCHVSNCSAGGLFLVLGSGVGERVRSRGFLVDLGGEEITIDIPMNPGAESQVYSVAFSVVRTTESGLGVIYSDAALPRVLPAAGRSDGEKAL